ncbi:MAG: hypothetical protein R3B48_05580 [Kofleriaceae bacterium]
MKRMSWFLLAMIASGAACTSDYALTLVVSDELNATCSTSCVKSVAVWIYGKDDVDFRCFENLTMKSLREHGLDGAIDAAIPDGGLLGAEIAGYRGPTCDDLVVFDAIGPARGHGLALPTECSASCSFVGNLNVRTTDIVEAMQGRCSAGPGLSVTAGAMRASHLSSVFPGYTGEATIFTGGKSVNLSTGAAAIPDGVSSSGGSRSCPAVMVTGASGVPSTVACVRSGYRGLCGPAGTIEVPTFTGGVLTDIAKGYRTVAIFAERDGVTGLPKPIQNATVVADPGGPPSTITYLELDGNGALRPSAGTSTGPTGAFEVVSPEPLFITVTSNGMQYRRLVSGTTMYTPTNIFDITGAQIFTPE